MSAWVEKYRPDKLEDVILPSTTRKTIHGILSSTTADTFVNLLFSGPPGTGKTTVAKIIPKTLDLPSLYINASEEGGIDIVRTRIKDFSMSQTIDGKLKVVILDEADGMSGSMQAALRNTIEATNKSTRFILTCNYPEKIIPPIHSRLKQVTFSKVDEKTILRRVYAILKTEGITIPETEAKNLILLIKKYHPDVRKIINHLQYFSVTGTLEIHFDETVSIDIFEEIMTLIRNKKLSEIRSILRNNKLEYYGLIRKIFDELLDTSSTYFKDMNEGKRAEAILICTEAQYKHSLVMDKEMNFADFLINFMRSNIWGT